MFNSFVKVILRKPLICYIISILPSTLPEKKSIVRYLLRYADILYFIVTLHI